MRPIVVSFASVSASRRPGVPDELASCRTAEVDGICAARRRTVTRNPMGLLTGARLAKHAGAAALAARRKPMWNACSSFVAPKMEISGPRGPSPSGTSQ